MSFVAVVVTKRLQASNCFATAHMAPAALRRAFDLLLGLGAADQGLHL